MAFYTTETFRAEFKLLFALLHFVTDHIFWEFAGRNSTNAFMNCEIKEKLSGGMSFFILSSIVLSPTLLF